MASLGRCSGHCGVFCGYNKDCCKVNQTSLTHHHHHSHFRRENCGGKGDVPGLCLSRHEKQCQAAFCSGMKLYHSVMSQTYQAERVLKEQERLQRLGVPGIPFGHGSSIQGNPMRSANYKSSSKYHKNCSKEE